ncbi:MAG TPA: MarR family transcriptional regulator [Marmoricola sp.]|nr:MarR family transcriptional regulator [Marmoricola sp.]
MDDTSADELVTALLTASRALVGVSARSLATVEDTVTIAQFRSLVVLATKGPSTLAHLAGELGVTASTAQRQVDRLVGQELVTRRENPEDRREVVITITTAGKRIVDTATRRRRKAIAAIVANMSPVDSDALIEALDAFARAASEPIADSDGAARLGW